MDANVETLYAALKRAASVRPKVGGFPYLAESLRRAGITRNVWHLPACSSTYIFKDRAVAVPMTPLTSDGTEVPPFDEAALIRALRKDQAGESSFPEFLANAWKAGVVGFEVDFIERTVTYRGVLDETYVEAYPAVELPD